MVGVLVAMQEEAEPIIKALHLEEKNKNIYYGMVNSEIVLLFVTGVGKVNAQNDAWTAIGLGCDRILNVGSAGDCGNHGVGSVVCPNMFFDGDFDLSCMGDTTKDPAFVNLKYAIKGSKPPKKIERCYTYSQFVDDARITGAVVDMEAYSIAAACERLGTPFIAMKCISDCADSDAQESFSDNVENSENSVIAKHMESVKRLITNFDEEYDRIYEREE